MSQARKFLEGSISAERLLSLESSAGSGIVKPDLTVRYESLNRVITVSEGDREVTFDPANGLGQVPLNEQIDSRGFIAWMSCRAFRKLTTTRPEQDVSFFVDQLKQGRSFGNPYLQVVWRDDFDFWEVYGHEGRGRCLAIEEYLGTKTKIPVHIFPRRAEDDDDFPEKMMPGEITDEMIEEFKNGVVDQETQPLSEGLADIVDSFKTEFDTEIEIN